MLNLQSEMQHHCTMDVSGRLKLATIICSKLFYTVTTNKSDIRN